MRLALLVLAALACLVAHGGAEPGSAADVLKWAQPTPNKPNRPQVRTDLRFAAPSRLTPSSATPRTAAASWGPGHRQQHQQQQQQGAGYRRTDSGYASSHGSRSPSLSPQKSPAAWGLFGRAPTAAPAHTPGHTPAPTKQGSKQPPCDCNCYSRPQSLLCAMDPVTRDRETFMNQCQVDCLNCTSRKRYKVVASVPCEDLKD